ncbi:MAG: hypothetical protein ACM3VW_10245 [Bacteroidota bacterium]
MTALSDDRQRELLAEVERLRPQAEAAPGILPPSVLGTLRQVQSLLEEPASDITRLAMLGHGLLRWHLDQGFKEVELHVAVAALATRLIELKAEG